MGLFDFFRNTADINAGVAEYEKTNGAVLLDAVKDKSTPLYVHCYSGSRSGQAVSYLDQMGYTNATNIGGISSYRGKVVK